MNGSCLSQNSKVQNNKNETLTHAHTHEWTSGVNLKIRRKKKSQKHRNFLIYDTHPSICVCVAVIYDVRCVVKVKKKKRPSLSVRNGWKWFLFFFHFVFDLRLFRWVPKRNATQTCCSLVLRHVMPTRCERRQSIRSAKIINKAKSADRFPRNKFLLVKRRERTKFDSKFILQSIRFCFVFHLVCGAGCSVTRNIETQTAEQNKRNNFPADVS